MGGDREARIQPGVEPFPNYRDRDERGEHWYGCRHIQLNGDCGIYETRPQMCRTYPDGRDCLFDGCTMTPQTLELAKKVVESTQRAGGKVKAHLIDAASLTKKVRTKKR